MSKSKSREPLPAFISTQVDDARRFFLNLSPNRRSRFEVVCGGVERVRTDYMVDRSDFPYFGIEFVAEGHGVVTMHGRKHQLSPGTLFAYGPGVAHRIRNQSNEGMRKYYLDFVGTRGSRLLADSGLYSKHGKFKVVLVGAIHEVAELFEMFLRNASQEGGMVTPICESIFNLLMLKVAQLRLPKGKSVPRSYATYERVRRHIDQRYLEVHSIQEVADECEVTPVYLSSLFQRYSECGAYQYLLRRKMNFAAGLLMNEGLRVQEVAERLGMADAFQFSRSFKRVFGVPPSQLLESQA